MKNIFIVGSTGALGREAIEVIESLGDEYKILGITGFNNENLLVEQAKKFNTRYLGASKEVLPKLKKGIEGAYIFDVQSDLVNVLEDLKPDLTLFLASGINSLPSIINNVSNGLMTAIANKESIIAGGDLVFNANTRKYILPVDSEASAVFQALLGEALNSINRIILTASGGPFIDYAYDTLDNISPELALKHPNWVMGNKITIDSATMVNKAFEVIESHFLFGIPYSKINVLVHKESVVHSLVEFSDGMLKAVLSVPKMLFPLQYAITYPERIYNEFSKLHLEDIGKLSFERVDINKFKAFSTVLEYGKKGGNFLPIAVAADEVLVGAFLGGLIGFNEINDYLKKIIDVFEYTEVNSYEAIEFFYKSASSKAREFVRRKT